MYRKGNNLHGSGGHPEHFGTGNTGSRSAHMVNEDIRKKNGDAGELRQLLASIDHRGYPAYKSLTGSYAFDGYVLGIDHVQGDPFASPSSLSIHISGKMAGFPEKYWKGDDRYHVRVALQDYLIRRFHGNILKYSHRASGSGKSGLMSCSAPGQEILDRSACQADPVDGSIVFRFSVGFPAAGRTVLAGELEKILFSFLPDCVYGSLMYEQLPKDEVNEVADLAEDQEALRKAAGEAGLAAFVADGAVLPRESGISQRPMKNAVPFTSPDSLRVSFDLPHRGKITGMGIKRGVTLVIGGGYHGKSTLLQALERGVYDHTGGDGREYVVTDPTAVKLRAEDGRCVMNDDISSFIRDLPSGKDTENFSTEDASGSTSQAASLVEAVESGSKVLLMDEDTCATNFMVRDELMQRVVSEDQEPIIPYSGRMRPLYEQYGISTILVAGSSGAFFRGADTIILMDRYVPYDVTAKVKKILETVHAGEDTESFLPLSSQTGPSSAGLYKGQVRPDAETDSKKSTERSTEKRTERCGEARDHDNIALKCDFSGRKPLPGPEFSDRGGRVKHKNLGADGFSIGHSTVDLRAVEQIVDREQTECLAQLLILAAKHEMDGKNTVQDIVRKRMAVTEKKGPAGAVEGRVPGDLALPRPQELFAAISRCRFLKM